MPQALWDLFSKKTLSMAKNALRDIRSAEEWSRIRAERKQEFLHTLGLMPMPSRCDLDIREFGELSRQGFRIRKIGFQILLNCWASAVIYYPLPSSLERHPAVLYVCGHSPSLEHYQTHGIHWARRGYVCLMLNTIEQEDNPGEHHGMLLGWLDRWISLGYSAAGGELWNSIRALDVLSADPLVDPNRIGTTGKSGGGSLSFLLACVDERIQAVSSLCGVSTPADAVANRHLHAHCGCYYPINYYGRDISEYAGLIAPRASLFCFGDYDGLFHPQETKRFVSLTKKIYNLLGVPEKCELVSYPCGHVVHPVFQEATQKWFDQYVSGDKHPLLDLGEQELSEPELCVFQGTPPSPNYLHLLPSLLSPRGCLPLPQAQKDWQSMRHSAVQSLQKFVFRDLPEKFDSPGLKLDGDYRTDNFFVRQYLGNIEGVGTEFYAVSPAESVQYTLIVLASQRQTTSQALLTGAHAVNQSRFAWAGFNHRWSMNGIERTRLSDMRLSSSLDVHAALCQAMALTGNTPVKLIVADTLCLVRALAEHEAFPNKRIILYGRGDAGVAAIYAAILNPDIAGVIAEDIVGSHHEGSSLPGILRNFDLPEAVGLLFPRPVALINPVKTSWNWPIRLYRRLGKGESLLITGKHVAQCVAHITYNV